MQAEAAESGGTGAIRAAFGYFEKSAFEPQDWLRPVFSFILEAEAFEDLPGYRRGFVEAATESFLIGNTEGLEGWCSEIA